MSELDVQNRFVPSIFSCKRKQVAQTLSAPSIQPGVVRNDLSSIRSEYCPKNLFYAHELGGPNITGKMEHEDPGIPRRLFASTPECSHASRACQNNCTNITKTGVANKFRKICSFSSKEYNLFRGTMETMENQKILPKQKAQGIITKINQVLEQEQLTLKELQQIVGLLNFASFVVPRGRLNHRRLLRFMNLLPVLPSKTYLPPQGVLEDLTWWAQNCQRSTSSVPSSNKFPDYRRIRSSVRGAQLNNLALSGTWSQEEKTLHCNQKEMLAILYALQNQVHWLQQSSLLIQSDNRTAFTYLRKEGGTRTLSLLEITYQILNLLDQHQIHFSIHYIPGKYNNHADHLSRLTDLCGNSVFKMGNPNNRSICLGDCSRSIQLRVSRSKRSSSSVPRCLQCPMELPARMDISTTISSPQSPVSLKPVDRNIPNSSTSMGEGILACGSQSPSACSSFNSEKPAEILNRHVDGTPTTESREQCPRSLEMWGWSDAIKTWNTQQLSLLKNSWRKSTLKTYDVAWKRWTSWCRNKNLDLMNPPGSQLAQFLCDLYLIDKLSYNSILLHKSVISTLCNAETSSQLSSHVLVRHVLKSISLKNPRITKPLVWDVGELISFLTNYTIDSNNLFQTSRHTAILLLLCSGRRIHDLTLLNIDPNHCIRSDNSIIFWPRFGSKTDSSNYRQSGWKLLLNTDSSNLNPIFWIERTITLLNDRRNAAKSTNLFITVRGVSKPASRTVIAGWVKTLFGEAGIAATPGSIRSAVASKSWFQNHPLDEILARGNWRSANTFQQFYRREIMRSTDSQNVTQLFNPID